jgi:uncharacterized membrane protein (DUF2068 family)
MYCSGCGKVLASGQGFCPQCGRPAAPQVPPVPGFQFQMESYAGKVRALGILWFAYAVVSLVLGAVGLTVAHEFLFGHFGPWMNGPWSRGPLPPMWFGPVILHFAWAILVARTCLALVAGWGLLERTQWGRVVAVVAAIFSLLKFPLGTALGIGTLVVLLGYRNATFYDQL